MGRTKGAKGKKNKQLLLSEESRKKIERGLQEAREGKLERIDLEKELIKTPPLCHRLLKDRKQECSQKNEHSQIVNNSLVEKNNNQISQERRDKLNTVLREINKVIPNAVQYANTIEIKERQSFGYKCLDKLTGGGIIRGNCNVIWGSKGCGKTTIALKLIATAQKEGKIAAYLDVERSYDPIWAKSFGVDTENLVYVVCPTAEAVMDTVIKLCKEKVVDVIVLDSVQGLSPHGEQYEGKADKEKSVQDDTMALLARKLSQFFRMATPYISDAKCALLMIGQSRMDLGSFIKMETLSGGHALMHNSRLILRIRRGQGADAPAEKRPSGKITEKGKPEMKSIPIGFDLVVHVNKSQLQGCIEGDEIHVPFYYTEGIKE
jgi:RecA/RadA recombinase